MIVYPDVKINLGLSVLRRRPDGFHDLETLFVPCHSVHDTMEIIPADSWSETSASLFSRYDAGAGQLVQDVTPDGKVMITIARAEGVDWDPLTDLTVRAYQLLASDYNLPSVKIFLEKTSPVGAGLGGGSADAAYALRALSELFGLGLPDAILASYAARLGSDCAFFVYDTPMFGTGRGEVLTPYEGVRAYFSEGSDYLEVEGEVFRLELVIPQGISVSTREAYGGIVPRFAVPLAGSSRQLSSNSTQASLADKPSLREALALPASSWRDSLVNDFETTVFAKHPELADLKSALYERGAIYASMSGSGSALYGLFAVPAPQK